jgi:hypothetical protein
VPGHAAMLSAGRQRNRWPAVLRRPEAAVEPGGDRPGGDAYVYALTDEAAYLQAEDEKPAVIARPPARPCPVQVLVLQEAPPAGAAAVWRRGLTLTFALATRGTLSGQGKAPLQVPPESANR